MLPRTSRIWEGGPSGDGQRLIADGVEASPGGSINPPLGTSDGDVHPTVVTEIDGTEEEMVSTMKGGWPVDRWLGSRQSGSGSLSRSRCDHIHRFDAVPAILGEFRFHHIGIDAVPPVAGNEIHLQPQTERHVFPEGGKMSRLEHQDLIARGQGVDQAGLPGARPRRGKDDDRIFRLEDPPATGKAGLGQRLNSGPRWSMVGLAMALRTRSGTLVGRESEKMTSL